MIPPFAASRATSGATIRISRGAARRHDCPRELYYYYIAPYLPVNYIRCFLSCYHGDAASLRTCTSGDRRGHARMRNGICCRRCNVSLDNVTYRPGWVHSFKVPRLFTSSIGLVNWLCAVSGINRLNHVRHWVKIFAGNMLYKKWENTG